MCVCVCLIIEYYKTNYIQIYTPLKVSNDKTILIFIALKNIEMKQSNSNIKK